MTYVFVYLQCVRWAWGMGPSPWDLSVRQQDCCLCFVCCSVLRMCVCVWADCKFPALGEIRTMHKYVGKCHFHLVAFKVADQWIWRRKVCATNLNCIWMSYLLCKMCTRRSRKKIEKTANKKRSQINFKLRACHDNNSSNATWNTMNVERWMELCKFVFEQFSLFFCCF